VLLLCGAIRLPLLGAPSMSDAPRVPRLTPNKPRLFNRKSQPFPRYTHTPASGTCHTETRVFQGCLGLQHAFHVVGHGECRRGGGGLFTLLTRAHRHRHRRRHTHSQGCIIVSFRTGNFPNPKRTLSEFRGWRKKIARPVRNFPKTKNRIAVSRLSAKRAPPDPGVPGVS